MSIVYHRDVDDDSEHDCYGEIVGIVDDLTNTFGAVATVEAVNDHCWYGPVQTRACLSYWEDEGSLIRWTVGDQTVWTTGTSFLRNDLQEILTAESVPDDIARYAAEMALQLLTMTADLQARVDDLDTAAAHAQAILRKAAGY